MKLRVHSITFGAKDIHLFDLRSPDGMALPLFAPGAHVRVKTDIGMVRSYSLMNDTEEHDRYVIGVQRDRDSRGGSKWMHEAVRVGQLLEVIGPFNSFPLDEAAERSIFIAGGIGITPLWSMIQRLEYLKRPWALHYRTRSAETALLLDSLRKPCRADQINVSFGDRTDRLSFDVGRIVREAPPETHLYCCGPPSMIEEFLEAGKSTPVAQLHVEYFQAEEAPANDGGYKVRLARSQRTIEVSKGKSILSAVLEHGIVAPYSCQEGLCGECETMVISGVPDHRDLFLTQAEKKAGSKIMICCSGSLTPILELDL